MRGDVAMVSRSRHGLWMILCAVVLIGVALTVPRPSAPVAGAVVPGGNGKIVFASDRDGNNEIYVMDADGSHQTRLTNNPADDILPAWSPDGTKIAWSTNRLGGSNYEIFVMNADGSNPGTSPTTGVLTGSRRGRPTVARSPT